MSTQISTRQINTAVNRIKEKVCIKKKEKTTKIIRYAHDGSDLDTDIDVAYDRKSKERITGKIFVAIMRLFKTDLGTYMKEESLSVDGVKKLMKQLLERVKVLHEKKVAHGNLKPRNILISKGGGGLKIYNSTNATRVSLWFAPPEMQRVQHCFPSEDMWNVGCVMAEMVLDKVVEDEEHHVRKVYKILGGPMHTRIPREKFVLGEDGFDLLKKFLCANPCQRITAESALNHVWFHT